MLSMLYEEAYPKLINKFTKREENIKMNVLDTFIQLLGQTRTIKKQANMYEISPRWLLKQDEIMSIKRQLLEKSIKIKVGAFSALKELLVTPDWLADHIGSLIPGIVKALCDNSAIFNLKIQALVFTRILFASHSPFIFHPCIKTLSSSVSSDVGEDNYKVMNEALGVCRVLIRIIQPTIKGYGFELKPYVHPIYNATNQDPDQEVKKCAIYCIGINISMFVHDLKVKLPVSIHVLVDRMKLTTFLHDANRALRQGTFGMLKSLVVACCGKICLEAYKVIIWELTAPIYDLGLHMMVIASELCHAYMIVRSSIISVGSTTRNEVLLQAPTFIRNSLLQGQAKLALQNLFTSYTANASIDNLLDSLHSTTKQCTGGVAKQALSSISQCVAVFCLAACGNKRSSTVKMLADILKNDGGTNLTKQHLALLCLGEIRRSEHLSSRAHIENIVIESFQFPCEKSKSAATCALRTIAVDNLTSEAICGETKLQDSSVDMMLKWLFNHCGSDNGLRNVVPEFLGKISFTKPAKLSFALKKRTRSHAAFTRATIVSRTSTEDG